jgi:hypothetical protein
LAPRTGRARRHDRAHHGRRHAAFGRLDKAPDAAALNKWTIVDMKNDWKRIFGFE